MFLDCYRSEALDCPGKLQWSPPHVVVVVGPPEVGDSPVVVVAEVTRARAPVSHVSWFHLEVSEDSSMLILTSLPSKSARPIKLSCDQGALGSEIPKSECLPREVVVLPCSEDLPSISMKN